jgi:transposase, IS5 family
MAADQGSGYEHYRKPTRHDEFLKTMQAIVPWAALWASPSKSGVPAAGL